ncbi:MAG: orotidine 5'-phosphate decarboxylase [Parcubacteria group bacterium CG1_02_39_15]|uniref:Orotidine-5'-phosphate decarboxylase n=4 Tax=Candidatus Nealsoniibacteriota TaxID=1817911 RepID=A0A2G9YST1_9BACT|nr:MAG: orotidine 5'-phosphate decarboxylase [Parcubacteria group bacterium CG1_02_39_15]PIP22259.1 MAG: orotidine-5'-phosphate decarboxylase [Candidatus Nealsonbacteria bacterium CG23_combo_of_CG06-09_8_20_14_all_39_25]PIQ98356.1 MAG: orotidine-5'-phosphate decarboxylase [Candidatus Nealsonbacteria bacterium CG11_big_fil_rev_8_21_14_0_20_39_9]PIW90512.1 MAG: orotidine-5'-phosphate decarboxylase [Candidatus Nealsonbacteria bacterium CG_4_8_14_3_um_filter_40_11]PIZ88068.1 MAG: orotidine-5'-phosp
MTRVFSELINARWDEKKSVCVGLDSERGKIPSASVKDTDEETLVYFNSAIVDATCDLVCAYKPNWAFYLALGLPGLSALVKTVAYANKRAPGVPVIGDTKVADIGNTNNGYVKAAFEVFGFDAITLHPYLGGEALQPFLSRPDKGFFVLSRTSNPGAGEFQDIRDDGDCIPFFMRVAKAVVEWNKLGNCGIVVGATYPEELKDIRQEVGNLPILIPGLGAQGGEVEPAVKYGMSERKKDAIYNSARAIIFGSSGSDFAEVARQKTIELHEMINQYRQVER